MFIDRRLHHLAPSGATSGNAQMPLLTELECMIHRISINIALLTERKKGRCELNSKRRLLQNNSFCLNA